MGEVDYHGGGTWWWWWFGGAFCVDTVCGVCVRESAVLCSPLPHGQPTSLVNNSHCLAHTNQHHPHLFTGTVRYPLYQTLCGSPSSSPPLVPSHPPQHPPHASPSTPLRSNSSNTCFSKALTNVKKALTTYPGAPPTRRGGPWLWWACFRRLPPLSFVRRSRPQKHLHLG